MLDKPKDNQFILSTLNKALKLGKPRKDRYKRFWNMYIGNHWERGDYKANPERRVTYEQRDGFSVEPLTDITANFVATILDKVNLFTVGKEFSVLFPEKREEVLKPIVSRILEDSNKEQFSMELLQTGSVSGDGYIFVGWDVTANYGYGGSIIEVYDPSSVFPVYRYKNGKYQMTACVIEILGEREDGTKEHSYHVWDDERLLVYRQSEKLENDMQYVDSVDLGTQFEYIPEESGPNMLGEIPIVHISNFTVAKDTFGRSDVLNLMNLNKVYNNILMQYNTVNEYHGSPTTIVKGADAKGLEKGPNKIWGIPSTADVYNLDSKTSPLHEKLEELVRQLLFIQGNVPEKSVGQDQKISNTSGVALSIAYLPLTEAVQKKRIFYRKGISEAIQKALKLEATMDNKRFSGLDNSEDIPFWYVGIKFNDFLPKDRMEELNQIEKEMMLGLESARGAMQRLGVTNIDTKLQEVVLDKIREFVIESRMMESLGDNVLEETSKNRQGGYEYQGSRRDPVFYDTWWQIECRQTRTVAL